MIRFMLAVCCLVVAMIVAPFAWGNPAFNSADLIVCVAPVGFVLLILSASRRRVRGPEEPVATLDIPTEELRSLSRLDRLDMERRR